MILLAERERPARSEPRPSACGAVARRVLRRRLVPARRRSPRCVDERCAVAGRLFRPPRRRARLGRTGARTTSLNARRMPGEPASCGGRRGRKPADARPAVVDRAMTIPARARACTAAPHAAVTGVRRSTGLAEASVAAVTQPSTARTIRLAPAQRSDTADAQFRSDGTRHRDDADATGLARRPRRARAPRLRTVGPRAGISSSPMATRTSCSAAGVAAQRPSDVPRRAADQPEP